MNGVAAATTHQLPAEPEAAQLQELLRLCDPGAAAAGISGAPGDIPPAPVRGAGPARQLDAYLVSALTAPGISGVGDIPPAPVSEGLWQPPVLSPVPRLAAFTVTHTAHAKLLRLPGLSRLFSLTGTAHK